MRLCWWALAALGLTANLTAAVDAAQFQIVADSAEPDPLLRETTFELVFSRDPDLARPDSLGRPANATGALGLAALAVWFATRRPSYPAPRRGRAQDVLIRSAAAGSDAAHHAARSRL